MNINEGKIYFLYRWIINNAEYDDLWSLIILLKKYSKFFL